MDELASSPRLHFCSAYPELTTAIVLASLRLEQELDAFRYISRGLDDDGFAAAWRVFLTRSQQCL